MNYFVFNIQISPESWAEYYRVPSSSVVATSSDGRTVQFKARHLQKFVTRDGIAGTFRLTIDKNHDFVSLEAFKARQD